MKNKFFTIILAAVASFFAATTASAQSGSQSVNIKVENPGELSALLNQQISYTGDVYELTISGTLNEQDMSILSYLSNYSKLTSLDLSGTNITEAPYCNSLQDLKTVKLPETVTSVGNQAFYECSSLTSIELPNATSIGEFAFSGCFALTSIELPKATFIGSDAFFGCSALTSIELPNATSIGGSAFIYCSALTSMSLPNATSIGGSAFSNCSALTSMSLPNAISIGGSAFANCQNLKSISLPKVTYIDSGAFKHCSALTSIELPNATSIGYEAFYDCSALEKIILSEMLSTLDDYAFNQCSKIKEVYYPRENPIITSAFKNIPTGATLYVPAASLDLYMNHTSWDKFSNYIGVSDSISTLAFRSYYALTSTEGFSDKISLMLNETAHLAVATDSTLNVSDFQMNVNYSKYDYSYNTNYQRIYYIPTLINNSPIVADNVSVKMTLRSGQWNFLSLPFDCKVGDIEKEDGVYWVVRKYSGANRASGEGKTWITLTDNDTIKAGEGFILQCSRDYYSSDSYPTFTFHAIDNAKKNNIFTTASVSQSLAEYTSASAANRNWNLVGNPYPAYFNVSDIEEEAIVTVWNDYNYDVFSTLDDSYMLRPFEAYFVQRPLNVQVLTHSQSGRSHGIDYGTHTYTLLFELSSEDKNIIESPTFKELNENFGQESFSGTDETAYSYWNSLLQEININAQEVINDYAKKLNDKTLTLIMKLLKDGVVFKKNVWNNIYSSRSKERKAQMQPSRKVYNFMLTGEEMSDRARIVVNPEAQEAYEAGRDAAKFASLNADAPQLFVNRNGNSLAIDESPLESGKAKLGISSVKSSEYTISLSAINSNEGVLLTDNVTGTTTDLTTADYTFTAQPGTNASRFTVSFGTVNGIVDINENDNVNDDKAVYDLTGRRMAKTVKGLNIVNHRKIIVK